MIERDIEPFSILFEEVFAIYPQAKDQVPRQKAMYFRALSAYSIAQVRAALDAHVKDPVRGKFPPLPADVIAQIESRTAQDGHPGPEEAWAIARRADDENVTLVWTEEIAECWGICLPVLRGGDEVGARMAFKEAYVARIAKARQASKPVVWHATLGHDAAQRDAALEQAYAAGLLPQPERLKELPGPAHALSGKSKGVPGTVLERLAALKEEAAAPDRTAWARALRDREKAGGNLTELQRRAWRDALDTAPSGEVMGKFTPIPDHELPPGIRRHFRSEP